MFFDLSNFVEAGLSDLRRDSLNFFKNYVFGIRTPNWVISDKVDLLSKLPRKQKTFTKKQLSVNLDVYSNAALAQSDKLPSQSQVSLAKDT